MRRASRRSCVALSRRRAWRRTTSTSSRLRWTRCARVWGGAVLSPPCSRSDGSIDLAALPRHGGGARGAAHRRLGAATGGGDRLTCVCVCVCVGGGADGPARCRVRWKRCSCASRRSPATRPPWPMRTSGRASRGGCTETAVAAAAAAGAFPAVSVRGGGGVVGAVLAGAVRAASSSPHSLCSCD